MYVPTNFCMKLFLYVKRYLSLHIRFQNVFYSTIRFMC